MFLAGGLEGVSGGTASGKTTVCDMIIQQLHDHRVVLVNQVRFLLLLGLGVVYVFFLCSELVQLSFYLVFTVAALSMRLCCELQSFKCVTKS